MKRASKGWTPDLESSPLSFSHFLPIHQSFSLIIQLYCKSKILQISHSFAEIIKALADIIKSHRFHRFTQIFLK